MNEITISQNRYRELLISELKLQMLEAGGVDNWEGYSDSLRPDGEVSFWQEQKNINNEIYGAREE